MNVWMVLILAIAPGLFLLWFFYKKDKLEPEPKHLIVKTFFLGVALAVPVLIVQLPFLWLLPEVFLAVVIAPITEELGKFLVVRWGIYRNAEFDEPVDGIVYGATAALGFATIENIFYLLGAYLAPGNIFKGATPGEAVWTLFAIRSLLSVPGHALWGSLWGYALGVAKFSTPEKGRALVRNGLLLAMFSHALFNAFLSIQVPFAALGVLVVIPVCWRMAFRRIASALAASPHGYQALEDRQD
jgi:RsiW-degrading membrane proteinase PrsW (M82 family)